jgi:hypothetical protein
MTTDTKNTTARTRVHGALKHARRNKLEVNGEPIPTPAGWVSGWTLSRPEIGGTEGLRRLRELRAHGENNEMRRIVGSTAFEYRLAR